MQFKRWYKPGGYYFFTVVTYQRKRFLTDDFSRECLRKAWRIVKDKYQFDLIAFCLLPDHLHCIWKLPDWDDNYSKRWQILKSVFSREYRKNSELKHTLYRLKEGADVWQPRFWEHLIRDEDDLWKHIDYIHFNPVKHGLVSNMEDWSYSTYYKFVKMGFYKEDTLPSRLEAIQDMEMMGE